MTRVHLSFRGFPKLRWPSRHIEFDVRVAAGILIAANVLSAGALAAFQGTVDEPTFEVASLKRLPPGERTIPSVTGGPGTAAPFRVRFHGVSLMRLLTAAYDVSSDQVIGPRWLIEDKFDLDALLPEGSTAVSLRAMLRQLLRLRFHVETHRDGKEFTVYNLAVGPKGPKLRRSERGQREGDLDMRTLGAPKWNGKLDDEGCPVRLPGSQGMIGDVGSGCKAFRNTTIHDFIRVLENMLAIEDGSRFGPQAASAHITDSTGLEGEFDFNLKYNSAARLHSFLPNAPSFGDEGPRLAETLKDQLGLKLETKKARLEILVIDRVNRTPSEN